VSFARTGALQETSREELLFELASLGARPKDKTLSTRLERWPDAITFSRGVG